LGNKEKKTKKLETDVCQDLYEAVFHQFNEENLVKLENTLEEEGLEETLKAEEEMSKRLNEEEECTPDSKEVGRRATREKK